MTRAPTIFLLNNSLLYVIVSTFSPPALLQKQGSGEKISDLSPIILLACNYTGSVILVLIIVLSPILV